MRRQVAVFVAVLAVVVASVTTAVAVSVTNDGGDQFGMRGSGAMMSRDGAMHGMQVRTEYAYLAEMIAHHEEAVSAARQLERSERASMRDFGRAIVASQTAQIDQMQEWLADWYPERSGQVDYEPMMRDLTGLEGDRLDRAFLQDMIWHHMGAVMMSQQLLVRGVADHEQVADLAKTIRDEQRDEIFQMQRWLRAWFGAGWKHGPCGGMPGGMHGAS